MIPVYQKRSGLEPPHGSHYIVASNGTFIRKKMGWVDAVIPVEAVVTMPADISGLEPERASASLLLPSLPEGILAKALAVSKVVFDISRSEVCLLLHCGGQGYELTVPEQMVSPEGIEYDASNRVEDTLCVGTIHSHGVYPASHSPTDLEDEEYSDGVHITLGTLRAFPLFSLSAEIAIGGQRFPIEPAWFQGLHASGVLYKLEQDIDLKTVPAEWLDAIWHF
jgi:hypothetical protein